MMNRLLLSMLFVAATIPTVAMAQIPIQRFRACLSIEDMTKERLDCYDAIAPPEPKAVHARPKVIVECRFVKEEDERIQCFNSFLIERTTTKPKVTAPLPPIVRHSPTTTTERVRRGRGGCGSRGGAGYRLPNGKCASKRR
jgi:hypothetical protein